jgi:GMP synthase (glutamine-hydrolysing)
MFLIIQNDPQCPPGSCTEVLSAGGYSHLTIPGFLEEPFPELSQVTGLIVLGGDMGVHDTARFPHLNRVMAYMAQALQAGTPLLGICLGGQMLAQLSGGLVSSPSSHGEKGICQVTLNEAGASDPLFAGVTSPFVTFQLHDDSFTPPPGAVLLAHSSACPAQAFRLGERAYGLQFHPEVDRAIVSAWGDLSSPARDFLPDFLAAKESFDASSLTILANFTRLAAPASRP